MGFTSRSMFVKNYLKPAIALDLIRLEKPESSKAPNQIYYDDASSHTDVAIPPHYSGNRS